MSIIAFRRGDLDETSAIGAAACLAIETNPLGRNDDGDRQVAIFDARCQQVRTIRLANCATNSIFAQLRDTPKRRKLLRA